MCNRGLSIYTENLTIAFSGVLISWLILDKKTVFNLSEFSAYCDYFSFSSVFLLFFCRVISIFISRIFLFFGLNVFCAESIFFLFRYDLSLFFYTS